MLFLHFQLKKFQLFQQIYIYFDYFSRKVLIKINAHIMWLICCCCCCFCWLRCNISDAFISRRRFFLKTFIFSFSLLFVVIINPLTWLSPYHFGKYLAFKLASTCKKGNRSIGLPSRQIFDYRNICGTKWRNEKMNFNFDDTLKIN